MLTLELAKNLVDAVEHKASNMGVPVSIAVVDASGLLVAFSRMEDTILGGIQLAQDKAYTAVAFRTDTHEIQARAQVGGDLYGLNTLSGGKVVLFGGGLQLKIDGKVVGAIGVSGGKSGEQDAEIAGAALELLLEKPS